MIREFLPRTNGFLFGDPRLIFFEERLVNIVLFASAAGFLAASIVNIKLGAALVVTTLVFFVLSLLGYCLSRIGRRLTIATLAVFLIALSSVVYIWIANAGSLGAVPYFFAAILSVVALTQTGRFRIFALVLLVVSGLMMYSLEHFGLISIYEYPSSEARYYDNVFNIIVSALFTSIVIVLFKNEFNKERSRSETLLLNVLPKNIAEELKFTKESIASNHDDVTVLFADIVGFTELSSKLPPQEVVDLLNDVFTKFDHLVDKYGLEKIKTIGDAYMVAGNLTHLNGAHAQKIADFALELIAAAQLVSVPRNGRMLSVRVGIHVGPVTAGVIGTRRFLYDVWGDTVNVASRMESNSIPGKIQVTDAMRQKLADEFDVVPRGNITIKGKEEMNTYFLVGRNGNEA